jgi:hypothetical protein
MSSKKSKRAKFVNAKIAEHAKIRSDHVKEDAAVDTKPISPEKQAYLDRCAKRKRTLAELESRRRIKKIGITYDCKHNTDEAPFAFMVERGPKSQEPQATAK